MVTSSLLAAEALAHSETVTVLMIGGRMRGRTLATVDQWAVERLNSLVIDIAFLGTNGITVEHGLTTPDPAVAASESGDSGQGRATVRAGGGAFQVRGDEFLPVRARLRFRVDRHGGTELPAEEAQRYEALGPSVIRT